MYTNKSSDHENKLGLKVWTVLNKAIENDNIRREYLGSYHVYASYWADNKHLDITYRPGKNSRDAIEISASHSIFDSLNLKLYIKYFKGFGESLTSYDKETESYHMGVIIKHPILN
jgi:outer membrane phospholipase A